ncbi:MAG: hypothetical protein H6Q89_3822 [Myxococcaceae bacterium]|nr:hypothetical protein [Myxococcaceae bacterium]
MLMRTLRCEVVLPLLSAALVFAGCTGTGDVGASLPSGVGRLEAALTATNGSNGMQVQSTSPGRKLGVKEIIVTVAKVTAHSSAGGWTTVSSREVTVDILKLAQFSQELGFANIPAGKVTQVRLYLAENSPQYVTRDDGVRVDLKVPSGLQSGIKIKGLFDIAGCNLTSLPLQIDAKKSIWVHPTGQEDLWILRPVIRMGKIEASNLGCTPPPVIPGTGGGTGAGGAGGTGGSGGGSDFPEGPGDGTGLPGGNPLPVGGTGSSCATPLTCLSGVCTSGICGKGGPDAPCALAVDCVSGTCASGTCTVGGAGGTGTACTVNSQCMSNGCVAGKCGEGGQGQPCAAAIDCAVGFSCVAGSCASPIN